MQKTMFIFIISMVLLSSIVFAGADVIWREDFDEVENWYDNKTDASFRAMIAKGKDSGTAEVIQKGDGNWGKVAFILGECDLDQFPIVRIKVNKVDKNGDYRVLAVSQDWSETFVIIDRGKGRGIRQGNIQEITGWKGVKTFNIVLVVEGKEKKVTCDWIEVTSVEKEDSTKQQEKAKNKIQ